MASQVGPTSHGRPHRGKRKGTLREAYPRHISKREIDTDEEYELHCEVS